MLETLPFEFCGLPSKTVLQVPQGPVESSPDSPLDGARMCGHEAPLGVG